MKKMASWVVGAATVLALAGCAAAPATGVESTAASADDSLTPDEVERAAIPSSEFASAVGPVLESFPNDYAFFYFDSDVQPVIGFTSAAVPAVMEAVTSTGQHAQIIEDTGFTHAEYTAAAEKVIVELRATWPHDVPFPMIGERPDLGVGVIGAIRITPDAARSSEERTQVLEESTRLIEEADTKSPFSIKIDEKRVYGEGHAASYGG